MNICMVTHDFPPMVGGIAAHVFELSKKLAEMNHNIYVIAPKLKGTNGKYEGNNRISVFYMQEYIDKYLNSKLLPIKILEYSLKANLKLRKLISKYSIDVVHYHNLAPESLITKGISIPVIFTAHESYFLKMAERDKKRLHFYLSHIDYLIAPSQELHDVALKYSNPPRGSKFIPNGVDISKFSVKNNSTELRRKFDIPEKDKIILSARRLVEKNGVRYLIEAIPEIAKRIKNFKVVVAGDGDQASILKDRACKLNIEKHIIWAGTVKNEEMSIFYQASDLVVLPSLKEATSITGLEAMSCGKPLVGTTVGGIPYLIDEGKTGFLVPPEKPFELAEKIADVLKDDELRAKMGKNARQKIEDKFSWQSIVSETVNIYHQVRMN